MGQRGGAMGVAREGKEEILREWDTGGNKMPLQVLPGPPHFFPNNEDWFVSLAEVDRASPAL